MTGCGTTTYTDPDDFCVNVSGAAIDLMLTSSDAFKARATWVKLRRLGLVLIEASTPHIAFLSLDPTRVYISFPLRGEPTWNGVRVRRGDFAVHGVGSHMHQLAISSVRWSMVSIGAKDLASYARTLLGRDLMLPHGSHFMRPSSKAVSDILHLQTTACRLAATKPDMMTHHEVTRSIEQDLVVALVNLLAGPEAADRRHSRNLRRAAIMARFEHALAAESHQKLSTLSARLGVPQRTLRVCCRAFLGRSPLEYIQLRRLNLARSAISRADHETASIAGIAKSHGFSGPGRFAGAYRALFGESPSATLTRNSAESA
jgi:AraC-like DNA-binding protein